MGLAFAFADKGRFTNEFGIQIEAEQQYGTGSNTGYSRVAVDVYVSDLA